MAKLGEAGLATKAAPPDGPPRWRRVVVEKPFGRDLESALALNTALRQVLREEQIFRIDHYLGKETVQNLLVFRFANGIFEPIWNRRYVDHVQITVAETLGVEGRGAYYERAGALRDIVQNHILQLLSLVAMEPPATLAGEAVRDEKVKVLQAIRPQPPEALLSTAVRGQYGDGRVEGAAVPGYRQEPSVAPGSQMETFAALKLEVENWRWAGVPFYVRSGKRLGARDTRIVVQFKRPPLLLFRGGRGLGRGAEPPGDPDPARGGDPHLHEGQGPRAAHPALRREARLQLRRLRPAAEGHRLRAAAPRRHAGRRRRSSTAPTWWRRPGGWPTPVLDLWGSLPARDFPNYAAGSHGPAAADELLARDGRRWIEP